MTWIKEQDNSVVLSLRIVPNAKKTEIQGEHGDALKIRIQSPPVDGKANAELIKFLSKKIGVHKSAIHIVSGDTGRDKRVMIHGISYEKVKEVL